MNKHDVIGQAIAAIPAWLAFLDMKEAEQRAILQEIVSQDTAVANEALANEALADALLEDEREGAPYEEDDGPLPDDTFAGDDTAVAAPLAWLHEDAPPPAGEPQQPLPPVMPTTKADRDSGETPPWAA